MDGQQSIMTKIPMDGQQSIMTKVSMYRVEVQKRQTSVSS